MRKRSPFRVFLAVISILTSVFQSGCVMSVATPSTAMPLPTCVSTTPNPYENYVPNGASKIYQDYQSGVISLDNARKEAYLRLGENAKYRSAYEDLARDDNRMIRVTITLVDPVLVQYIVLNHVLRNMAISPSLMFDEYQNTVNHVMNLLGAREELLFLVTITSTDFVNQPYGSRLLTATIPFEQMELINTSDMRVPPTHDDHNLSEPIIVDNGPIFGYLSFPLSVTNDDNCVFIMDQWNTTLTLEVPSAQMGDKNFEALSWTFPYKRIISQNINQPVAFEYSYEKYWQITPENMQPNPVPPTPIWRPNAGDDPNNWQSYYQGMAQYFWYVIMIDPTH